MTLSDETIDFRDTLLHFHYKLTEEKPHAGETLRTKIWKIEQVRTYLESLGSIINQKEIRTFATKTLMSKSCRYCKEKLSATCLQTCMLNKINTLLERLEQEVRVERMH